MSRQEFLTDPNSSEVAEVFSFQLELTDTDEILNIYSGDGERLEATRSIPIGAGGKVHAMIPHLIPPESASDVLVHEPVPTKADKRPEPTALAADPSSSSP